MAYLLLVCDPDENVWSIIAQADFSPDSLIDEVRLGDPSHRIILNTDNFITYDTREEEGDGKRT